MPQAGFEPAIQASERQQTYALHLTVVLPLYAIIYDDGPSVLKDLG